MRDTRATLDVWRRDGWRVVDAWVVRSTLVAVVLLVAVWVVAELSIPDPAAIGAVWTHAGSGTTADLLYVLQRNGLVLLLHALACVAGFIAGSSLPATAREHSGAWRWVHEKAGPLAIAFVVCATAFSLVTQAYILGGTASNVAAQLGLSPGALVLGLLPHALPELIALFLPLAAWMLASRSGDWHKLLAATLVTVAIAVPVLIATAVVETYVTPGLLQALAT